MMKVKGKLDLKKSILMTVIKQSWFLVNSYLQMIRKFTIVVNNIKEYVISFTKYLNMIHVSSINTTKFRYSNF